MLRRHQANAGATPGARPSLTARFPSPARLKTGAEESIKESVQDAHAARHFQSMLELGYLVASADSLAPEEREVLALLLERASDRAVDREMLRLHFSDLDATIDALGRRERIGRAAADFETSEEREEAFSFTALVAMADGALDPAEMRALLDLGEHFSWPAEEVRALVDRVVESINKALDA